MYVPSGRARPNAPPSLDSVSGTCAGPAARSPSSQSSSRSRARSTRAAGNDRLARRGEVVGHAVAAERDVDVRRVVELDPVAHAAGLVGGRQRVRRHELVDGDPAVDVARDRGIGRGVGRRDAAVCGPRGAAAARVRIGPAPARRRCPRPDRVPAPPAPAAPVDTPDPPPPVSPVPPVAPPSPVSVVPSAPPRPPAPAASGT